MATDLKNKFREALEKYSVRTAVQFKKDGLWAEISYSEFGRKVENLSCLLLEKGVQKQDRVAILLEGRLEWPLILFSCISIGAVSVPLNPESILSETETFLKDSQCRFLFTSSSFLEKASSLECPSLTEVICVDSDDFQNGLESSAGGSAAYAQILPEDLACILYTSGTTDESKGVMLSHRNLLSNSESLCRLNILNSSDRVFSILPLHHAYPLTVTLFVPFFTGAKIIYPGTIRGELMLAAMSETNPTVFVAVPQIFHLFHKNVLERFKNMPAGLNALFNFAAGLMYKIRVRTKLNPARFIFSSIHKRFGKSLRLFVSGGAKLNEEAHLMLSKLGFTILEGYGLTETSPVLTINPLDKPKIGSVGFSIPQVELKIANKDKMGIGEVVVRGPNVMEGYYKREDLTALVFEDGWFHTGDLGYIDNEGYLFLTGRIKEVIVLSSGVNIYPEEVERAYLENAPVKEMCVFEVPAKKGFEENLVLWAVVVPDLEFFKKYAEVNLKSVLKERFDTVSRKMSSYKRLMGFTVTLEELPRTLLGKIKRFAVKEIYAPKIIEEESVAAAKVLSEADKLIMQSETGRKIVEYLKVQAGVKKEVFPSDLLELDLGIDSLGRIELACGLEKLFNVKINDEVIARVFSVGDLISGIGSLLEERLEELPADEKQISEVPESWNKLLDVLPRKENLEKIDLNPGFRARFWGFLFLGVVRLFFKVFYNLKVEGRDNLPKTGPYILYVNHTSYFDGFIVAGSLPRIPEPDLFFVGLRPYFDVPVVRNLIKIGRIIPLDFSSHFLEALRSSYYVLRNGKIICLFPEGGRSLDGSIKEFKKGFGILAKESNVKLVPLLIEGAFEAWPKISKFPKPYPIKVKIGSPFDSQDAQEDGYRLGAKDDYEAICLAAKNTLIGLKDKK